MVRVRIRVDDFEDGALPAVCVSSGREADGRYQFRAEHRPRWPLAFVLLGGIGVVITVIVGILTRRRVTGLLPLERDAHAEMEATRQRYWYGALAVVAAAGVIAVLLLVADHGRPSWIVAVIGVLVAAPLYLAGARPAGSVGVRLDPNGRTVVLTGVSEEFARRYQRQEAERLAARQATTWRIDA